MKKSFFIFGLIGVLLIFSILGFALVQKPVKETTNNVNLGELFYKGYGELALEKQNQETTGSEKPCSVVFVECEKGEVNG